MSVLLPILRLGRAFFHRADQPMDPVAEQIRTAAEARLRELQPILAEVEQLEGVLAVLGRPESGRPLLRRLNGGASSASARTLQRSSRLGSKRGRDGRAPQGANKQRILAVIAQHPGIAAPRIAELTDLKRPLVASTVSRLKRTGELEAHGEGVRLSSPSLGPASALLGRSWGEELAMLGHAAAAGQG